MAVQTLLSFSQSAVCRPHCHPMMSNSSVNSSVQKKLNQQEEVLSWNNSSVQPLTPPPSDVGSMSPLSESSVCEDSLDLAGHDDCDIYRVPEKSSSLLKEVGEIVIFITTGDHV